jgi:hypothetical protein
MGFNPRITGSFRSGVALRRKVVPFVTDGARGRVAAEEASVHLHGALADSAAEVIELNVWVVSEQ